MAITITIVRGRQWEKEEPWILNPIPTYHEAPCDLEEVTFPQV